MNNQQETPAISAMTPEGIVIPITMTELRDAVGADLMDDAVKRIVNSKISQAHQRQMGEAPLPRASADN